MNLSEHFTLEELTASDKAKALKLDNTPGDTEKANLKKLCNEVLEPIRKKYGKPIKITSGYRSNSVNTAVGGSKTSQHKSGSAADMQAVRGTNRQLFEAVLSLVKSGELKVGQLIHEFGTKTEPAWVHVSLPRTNGKPNNQILYLYSK